MRNIRLYKYATDQRPFSHYIEKGKNKVYVKTNRQSRKTYRFMVKFEDYLQESVEKKKTRRRFATFKAIVESKEKKNMNDLA
jgi:hypothetical protein